MQAPDFWNTSPDRPAWQARLLNPIGGLYAAATRRRLARGRPSQISCPVICVGNINAGGTGKTPTVIALIQMAQSWGYAPTVITRGYGGTTREARRVDPMRDQTEEVGDEPLLLAAFAPVIVGADRATCGALAVQGGADLIIMDDGFQDPALARDLSIVVVDAARGFGNGRCIPAGPLREPVATGLMRADLVLAIGDDAAQRGFVERWGATIPCPLYRAHLQPLETGMDWQGMRALAFAGIGHPEKFFATLRRLGVKLVDTVPLSDHQMLPQGLLRRLEADAARAGAQLVTTEKDAVRLPQDYRQKVLTLPVRLSLDDAGAFAGIVREILPPAQGA